MSDSEARGDYGFAGAGDLSGVLFPYPDPLSGRRLTARLRRDNPELENGKPKNKYLSPYGDRRHLYFPPESGSALSNTAVPIFIVEAEKSVLAITALASRSGRPLVTIACGGCWGWRGRIGVTTTALGERVDETGPLPDFDLIAWKDREAFVAFDSNAASNPKVRQARHALVLELHGRGAHIRIVQIPEAPSINGPDDFIAAAGDETFLQLVDCARTPSEVAAIEAEEAIAGLGADTDSRMSRRARSRHSESSCRRVRPSAPEKSRNANGEDSAMAYAGRPVCRQISNRKATRVGSSG